MTLHGTNTWLEIDRRVYPDNTYAEIKVCSPGVSRIILNREQTIALINELTKTLEN